MCQRKESVHHLVGTSWKRKHETQLCAIRAAKSYCWVMQSDASQVAKRKIKGNFIIDPSGKVIGAYLKKDDTIIVIGNGQHEASSWARWRHPSNFLASLLCTSQMYLEQFEAQVARTCANLGCRGLGQNKPRQTHCLQEWLQASKRSPTNILSASQQVLNWRSMPLAIGNVKSTPGKTKNSATQTWIILEHW